MKYVSVLLAIALVVVSGLAIHLSRELEAGRQRIAALDTQLQQWQAGSAAQVATPIALPALPPASSAPTTDQAPAPATAAEPPVRAAALDIATLQAQMSSPEGLARRRQTTRSLMTMSNPDLEEALGIAPEEAEKLLDLLAAQQEKSSAVFDNSRQSADPQAAQRQVSAALEQIRQENETELQQLLGSKYPEWQDYQQTRPAWQQRRDLTAVLDAAGTPMTEAQSRSLVAALAAEERNSRLQAAPGAVPFSRHTPERHQRLLSAAAPHLSAQQLESYRQMLERAAAQEQVLIAPFIRAAGEAATAR